MVRQVSKFICGLSVLSAVGLSSLAFTPTASAFTFTDSNDPDTRWDTVGITNDDVGKSFKVHYDGSVNTQLVSGLSALTKYTFLGFTYLNNDTFANFEILVKNTSNNGIKSRVSAIGFNTNLTEISGSTTGVNPTSPVYSKVHVGGQFPNQFGNIDVCITNGNNCQGGGNGGVTSAGYSVSGATQGEATFKTSIRLNEANANTIALSNFGVRFQSINGNGLNGASGTGKGWIKKPKDPNKVPEPMTGAALLAVGAVLAMKKRQQTSQNA